MPPPPLPTPIIRPGKLGLISAILGLLSCVPPVAIGGFVCGVVALSSGRPLRGGRPLAFLGLLLNATALVFAGWIYYTGFAYKEPATRFVEGVIRDLSAGNVAAARAKAMPEITDKELLDLRDRVQSKGAFRTISSTHVLYQSAYKAQRSGYTLACDVQFSRGAQHFDVTLERENGEFQLLELIPTP